MYLLSLCFIYNGVLAQDHITSLKALELELIEWMESEVVKLIGTFDVN